MTTFIKGTGDWNRKYGDCERVNFHFGRRDPYEKDYWTCMGEVYETALGALKRAQSEGKQFVLFQHGSSTSRAGQTTARSTVRGLMRSTKSSPYIIKARCVQHETVFLAAIRPLTKSR